MKESIPEPTRSHGAIGTLGQAAPPAFDLRLPRLLTAAAGALWILLTVFATALTPPIAHLVERAEFLLGLDVSIGEVP